MRNKRLRMIQNSRKMRNKRMRMIQNSRKMRNKRMRMIQIPEKCGIKECEFWTKFAFFNSAFFCSAGLFSALLSSLKVVARTMAPHVDLELIEKYLKTKTYPDAFVGLFYYSMFYFLFACL